MHYRKTLFSNCLSAAIGLPLLCFCAAVEPPTSGAIREARNPSLKVGAPLPSNPPKVEPATPLPSGYRLSSGDLIQIQVFQEDELHTTARVGKDGRITFPLLGSVVVGGRTIPETAATLTAALKEYLVRPQVAVRILEYTKRRFTVLGQVNRPGTFELPEENPLSLLEAIGMAGGYSRIANPSKVTVKRHSPDGKEEVFRLDAKQMAKSRSTAPFLIQSGDTLVIDESLF